MNADAGNTNARAAGAAGGQARVAGDDAPTAAPLVGNPAPVPTALAAAPSHADAVGAGGGGAQGPTAKRTARDRTHKWSARCA